MQRKNPGYEDLDGMLAMLEEEERNNTMDPSRPIGTQFNYLTNSYEEVPQDTLTTQQKSQDISRSMGILPDLTSNKLNKMREQKAEQEQLNDQMIDDELNALDQIPTPDVSGRDPFQAPNITPIQTQEKLATQEPQPFDLNAMISEYVNAQKKVQENKRDVANREALTNILSGGVSFAGQAAPTENVEYKALRDLADAPLDELEVRDKGRAMQQRLSATDLEMQRLQAEADPNSDVSQVAREQYAAVLKRTGREDLAAKVASGNMSYQKLQGLYGRMNLANESAIAASQDAKLKQAELKALQAEEKAQKSESEAGLKFLQQSAEKVNKIKEVKQAFNKLNDLVKRAVENPSSVRDYSVLIKYVKQLDESVVRTEEAQAFRRTAGIFQNLKNSLTQLNTDATKVRDLPPAVVKMIQDEVMSMGTGVNEDFEANLQPYRSIAEKRGYARDEFDAMMGVDLVSGKGNTKTEQKPAAARTPGKAPAEKKNWMLEKKN